MSFITGVTVAEATAAGYTKLFGAGRVQAWVSPPDQETKFYLFDTIGNNALQVDEATPDKVAIYAIAVVVRDLINIQSITQTQKNTAVAVMIDALKGL